MKRLILGFILATIFLWNTTYQPNHNLNFEVTVLDAETGVQIKNVSVTMEKESYFTNDTGEVDAVLSGKSEKYDIEVYKRGYEIYRDSIKIDRGNKIILLKKDPSYWQAQAEKKKKVTVKKDIQE